MLQFWAILEEDRLAKEACSLFKRSHLLPLLLIVVMVLGGWALQKQLVEKDKRIVTLERQIDFWDKVSASQKPLFPALEAMQFIKNNDMTALSALVHPTKGLRMTPYPHVDTAQDKVFTAQEVAGLAADTTVYQWGSYDGIGTPIKLTFSDYYKRFIYDHDFSLAPMIGTNHMIGKGNTIDNVTQAYPAGKYVEFYYPGFNPQYQGLDWSSLKLVFEQQDGIWYLVGIVHGQWTI